MTNVVALIMNTMNKVLKDWIPNINMPFLDDIHIKEHLEVEKGENSEEDACRMFVADHVADNDKMLQKLENAYLTFSGSKWHLGNCKFVVSASFWVTWL